MQVPNGTLGLPDIEKLKPARGDSMGLLDRIRGRRSSGSATRESGTAETSAARVVIVAGVGFTPEPEDLTRLVKMEEIPAAREGQCEHVVWPESLPPDQVEGEYGKAYLAATIPMIWDAAKMAVREQKGWTPEGSGSFRRLQVGSRTFLVLE